MVLLFKKELLLLLLCAAAPRDVVSLDLCTDQLALLLAPERIAALSPLARDPALSTVSAQAARLPWVRPELEAVLARRPGLILAGEWGARLVVAGLAARGVTVVRVAEPASLGAVPAAVRQVASALGVPARGEALVAQFTAALPPPRAARGPAVLWQAHGLAAGGTLTASVLAAAGWRNAGQGRVMEVETLASRPPALLITERAAAPSLATALLAHPALSAVRRVELDPAWLTCAGPWSVAAVRALAAVQ